VSAGAFPAANASGRFFRIDSQVREAINARREPPAHTTSCSSDTYAQLCGLPEVLDGSAAN
jgi:hypothetical protein